MSDKLLTTTDTYGQKGKIYMPNDKPVTTLLPCPFCGKSEPIVQIMELEEQGLKNDHVVCNAKKGGCGASSGALYHPRQVEVSWNKRS